MNSPDDFDVVDATLVVMEARLLWAFAEATACRGAVRVIADRRP